MQKETEILNGTEAADNSEDISVTKNDGFETDIMADAENTEQKTEETKSSALDLDFEELIKGPYKDAFAQKVQSIINKRFKKQKQAESKAENVTAPSAEVTQNGATSFAEEDPAYTNLLKAGVDPDTAYKVLHLTEFMDSSMRYGAELAAKQVADSIRQKAARPTESALSQKVFVAKTSVTALTPQKRRELAQKALMGEEIGF